MPPTYYEILGVSEHATTEQIEAAFKTRASEVHPDRVSPGNPYLRKIAAEAFKNLSEAKAVLLDPGKRQRYDKELARSRGSSEGKTSAAAPDFGATPPARAARRAPDARLGFAALAVLVGIVLALAGYWWTTLRSRPVSTGLPGAVTPASGSPSVPPRDAEVSSSATQERTNATARGESNAARAKTSSPGGPRTVTLWRSSQPPDLSGLNSSDRLNVESACSYAKLVSPDEYNGCLVHQLAIQGITPPSPELSTLLPSQREAIESACASTKLMQSPAAYNQCIARQLELAKRNAP